MPMRRRSGKRTPTRENGSPKTADAVTQTDFAGKPPGRDLPGGFLYANMRNSGGTIHGGGKDVYVIAGLGNPRKEYENTRHNIGFAVIDMLAEKHGIRLNEGKHKGLIGKGLIGGEKVILVKPLTYMNLSGECIREVLQYYKVDKESGLIVVHDDVSLCPGMIRVRKKGSAGGHNGLKNIILHLGSETFQRVKVGVGEKPPGYDLAEYVLGHFPESEKAVMEKAKAEACAAVETIITDGADAAMNRFNRKGKPEE